MDCGASVTALDLGSADWSRLPKGVKPVKVDILKRGELEGVFEGANIIYHLAARTDLNGKDLIDYAVNFVGTKNLIIEATKEKGLERIVFYSTQLVVGLFNNTRFIDETEPYKTKTLYGESKIRGELVTKKYCQKRKVPYTIIRPTSVYGPWGGEPYRLFFQTIKKNRYFHAGKANNLVSLVYVKNLINLTILSSLSKHAENQTYFCNDFHPYTMREVVDAVAAYYNITVRTLPIVVITPLAYVLGLLKLLGTSVPLYPFRLRNIRANYCYDIQKSVRLGYDPKYGLVDGLEETLDWYEARLWRTKSYE